MESGLESGVESGPYILVSSDARAPSESEICLEGDRRRRTAVELAHD